MPNHNHHMFVANWKMNMPLSKALAFSQEHAEELLRISNATSHAIVLCPIFPALYPLAQQFRNSPIKIGAQSCSQYPSGAYTGEVDAQSLAEAGCSYCIVGHSERRLYFNETPATVADKTERLIEQNLQPIICIGETSHDYEKKKTHLVLESQLAPIFNMLEKFSNQSFSLTFAYEPVWSIGTGITPDSSYLKDIFGWLYSLMRSNIAQNTRTRLIYGGSVDERTAHVMRSISYLEGFLIGGASLDFKKFKNIVLLDSKE